MCTHPCTVLIEGIKNHNLNPVIIIVFNKVFDSIDH